jgi:hypothetical protein
MSVRMVYVCSMNCVCVCFMYLVLQRPLDVTFTAKTHGDAGGDPGILRGGWTVFLGWRRRVSLPEILRNLIRDPATTPLRGGVPWATWQIHSACRGALNVVAKARCREGVRGASYSMDI